MVNRSEDLKMIEIQSLVKLTLGHSNGNCDLEPRLCTSGGDPQKEGFSSDCARLKRISSGRYKTELCRPFEETGECKYGEKCQFAHGAHELRQLPRHPKYKTELCRTFHTTGFCPYGPRCHFIHKEEPASKVVCAPPVSDQTVEPIALKPYILGNLGSATARPTVEQPEWSGLLRREIYSRCGLPSEGHVSRSQSLKCSPVMNRESILALAKLLNSLNVENPTVQKSNPTLAAINKLLVDASMQKCGVWSEGGNDTMFHSCYGFSQ